MSKQKDQLESESSTTVDKKENNKQDNKQDNRQEQANRRQVLKSTLAGGAVITASVMPDKWTRPAVDSVMLPAHAATTAADETPGGGPTPPPIPGPYFGQVFPPVRRIEDRGEIIIEEAAEVSPDSDSGMFASFLDMLVPGAHAQGLVERPDPVYWLCITLPTASTVEITLAVTNLPYAILYTGSGPLNSPVSLYNDCPGREVMNGPQCTASLPTPANIHYDFGGDFGGTIPANGCSLPPQMCPNVTIREDEAIELE